MKKLIKKLIEEDIDWLGVVAILLAYGLLSFNVITSNSVWYQALNLAGAAMIFIISFLKKDYQPAVLNVIWTIIALVALIKILF